MLNVYGPTETTVNATAAVCERDRPITIGRPLEGYEALVLDGDMRPLPQGQEGELYIGGPGIARGYLKRPDLTQLSFVPRRTTAGGSIALETLPASIRAARSNISAASIGR